jgi:trk system potassium uptake protein TrkH
MLLPVLVALLSHEPTMVIVFLGPAVIGALLAAAGIYLTRSATRQMLPRDGFVIVTGSWIIASAIGAVPFVLSHALPGYVDAFFETMSGFTTTGASVISNVEALPRAILFWRSLTHWLGGMGIIVLAVAVFPLIGIRAYQLVKAEAPGPTLERITPRMTHTAKILWLIYVGLSALETVLLMIAGLSPFDAITQTFGTMATGGFSTRNASVGSFGIPAVDIIITVFMVAAGMNFAVYYYLITARFSAVRVDSEFKAYIGIFVLATLTAAVSLHFQAGEAVGLSVRESAFQVASVLTTTGFATTNFDSWPAVAKTVLFLLMFIGGCAGSTAGGIKVVRIVTLMKQAANEMRYQIHPRAIFSLTLNGVSVQKTTVFGIVSFFFLYVLLVLITTGIVSLSGVSISGALTTALATLGNIGPGFAEIGPTKTYMFYPPAIKWFLSFIMMVGRLEVYTVLIAFSPGIWRR